MKLIALITAVAMACVGCAHTQQRPESNVYIVSEDATGVGAALAIGGSGHDCQKEHEECVNRCWKKRYPWPYSEQQSGWYHERCITQCREQFAECDKEQEEALRERERKLTFPSMRQAIEWIREHKTEVAIGAVVVVGGVAFALGISPLTGALVLVRIATAAS